MRTRNVSAARLEDLKLCCVGEVFIGDGSRLGKAVNFNRDDTHELFTYPY